MEHKIKIDESTKKLLQGLKTDLLEASAVSRILGLEFDDSDALYFALTLLARIALSDPSTLDHAATAIAETVVRKIGCNEVEHDI